MSDNEGKKNRYYGVIQTTVIPGQSNLVAEIVDRRRGISWIPHDVEIRVGGNGSNRTRRRLREWVKRKLERYNAPEAPVEVIEWP